jgi:hypothetical protein
MLEAAESNRNVGRIMFSRQAILELAALVFELLTDDGRESEKEKLFPFGVRRDIPLPNVLHTW